MSQSRIRRSPLSGLHNSNPAASSFRMINSNTYRDLSTVWVTPAREGKLDMQVVFQSWLSMLMPMNQKVMRLGIANGEVGKAYEAAVEMILRDPIQWKYMLTLETDNLPPREGLLKLYESIEKFDAVGGLYWTKGEFGSPMIYGDPSKPGDFVPQVPEPDALQRCNGLGMGFTLFNLDMFRKIPQPWFVSTEGIVHDELPTQDLFFFNKAAQAGYKFASDNRVRVGHIDFQTRKIW
jgi:hypothetical protein